MQMGIQSPSRALSSSPDSEPATPVGGEYDWRSYADLLVAAVYEISVMPGTNYDVRSEDLRELRAAAINDRPSVLASLVRRAHEPVRRPDDLFLLYFYT